VQANRNRFDTLMDQALGLLRAGDLAGALQDYVKAFAFHREEFDASSLGNVAKVAATSAQDTVRSSVATFGALLDALVADNRTLTASVDRGGPELQRLLTLQKERLVRLSGLATSVDQAGRTLARQRQSIPRGSLDAVEFFLYYSEKAITGRSGRENDEGILRAEVIGLEKASVGVTTALTQAVQQSRAQAIARFAGREWEEARDAFRLHEPLARALVEFSYLAEAHKALDPRYDPANPATLIFPADLPGFVQAQHLYREDAAYATLADARLDARGARTAAGWDPAALAGPIAAVEGVASGWSAYSVSLRAAAPKIAAQPNEVASAAADALKEWREGVLVTLSAPLAAIESEFTVQDALLRNGEQTTLPDGTTRTVNAPNRRLAALTALRGRASAIAAPIAAALKGGQGGGATPTAGGIDTLQGLQARTDGLLQRINAAIADATARTVAADSYKRQGDNEYRSAQVAAGRNQFAAARDAIARAAEAYDRSLDVQDDPAVRDLRDRVLPAMLAEVNKGENNLVVADVRRRIEAAVAAYRRTQFKEAEDLLAGAQARWRDANAEPNAEVENWLAIVRRALSTQEGWELAETQPLYRELVQLLKFAGDDFARGETLEAQRQTDQAQLAFTAAQQKLDTINLAAPRLKSANFLRLKITQKLDPAAFAGQLAEVKERARTAIASGAPKALGDSYSELNDFAQIAANDRDLAAVIERVEIVLGRRPAPPDPTRIEGSRSRLLEAQRIYDTRQRDLYGQAVRLLDEAISLYPENRDAVVLKDRILIDTGGARQDIISSDDLREFRQAEKLFSENNYPAANDLVKRLLQRPANRNYPPLIDLRDKLARRGFK
jgi:hypothetical protein